MTTVVLLNPKRIDGYPKIKYTSDKNIVAYKVDRNDPNFDKPIASLTKNY